MKQIVLPADVYDTLEFSALVHGGVGGGDWFTGVTMEYPWCIHGHAAWVTEGGYKTSLSPQLRYAGLGVDANDDAVRAINSRLGRRNLFARVTWEEYCAALNIVRGDA